MEKPTICRMYLQLLGCYKYLVITNKFKDFRFVKNLKGDNESITLSMLDFGIAASGKTQDEALEQLSEFLLEYAQVYIPFINAKIVHDFN